MEAKTIKRPHVKTKKENQINLITCLEATEPGDITEWHSNIKTTGGIKRMRSLYTGGLSLYTGSITWKVYPCGPIKCGLYKQVVFRVGFPVPLCRLWSSVDKISPSGGETTPWSWYHSAYILYASRHSSFSFTGSTDSPGKKYFCYQIHCTCMSNVISPQKYILYTPVVNIFYININLGQYFFVFCLEHQPLLLWPGFHKFTTI